MSMGRPIQRKQVEKEFSLMVPQAAKAPLFAADAFICRVGKDTNSPATPWIAHRACKTLPCPLALRHLLLSERATGHLPRSLAFQKIEDACIRCSHSSGASSACLRACNIIFGCSRLLQLRQRQPRLLSPENSHGKCNCGHLANLSRLSQEFLSVQCKQAVTRQSPARCLGFAKLAACRSKRARSAFKKLPESAQSARGCARKLPTPARVLRGQGKQAAAALTGLAFSRPLKR